MPDSNKTSSAQAVTCPLPLAHDSQIVMGHGSGGRMTHDLIARTFLSRLSNPALSAGDDAGLVRLGTGERLAISTDAHVVSPLFFPGGDIGRLAVCGTVNDVAMLGAEPRYLTIGLVLEEGLPLATLERVVDSMRTAADEARVDVIAGDTKVVQKGKADGLYVTTTGVGVMTREVLIGGAQARPGDVVILSGPMGDHGIAVLSARGELGFEAEVVSDTAPLNHLVSAMLDASSEIRVLRDPTRGGVATTLNEIALQSQVGIILDESTLPIRPAVNAACELLGLDPLYIANEGKLLACVAPEQADKVLAAMRRTHYGQDAVRIGNVTADPPGRVLLKTRLGSLRLVDMLSGEILPRIC